jgi:hypothetical protein
MHSLTVVTAEIYVYVNQLAIMTKSNFTIAVDDAKGGSLTSPDVLLAVLLTVAVKILYPFGGSEQDPSHQMAWDWNLWHARMPPLTTSHMKRADDGKLTPTDAWNADSQELDRILSAYEAKLGQGVGRTDRILDLFPIGQPASSGKLETLKAPDETEQDNVTREIMQAMDQRRFEEDHKLEDASNGRRYELYPTPDDTMAVAMAFHERLAWLVAYGLEDLLKTILKFEKRLFSMHKKSAYLAQDSASE